MNGRISPVLASICSRSGKLQRFPVPPGGHFGLGYLYWKQQRYEDACREFEAELADQPQDSQSLTYLGDAEMHTDREKQAEAHLRRALALDANSRLSHLDLGILLAARNQSEEAARHLRVGRQSVP